MQFHVVGETASLKGRGLNCFKILLYIIKVGEKACCNDGTVFSVYFVQFCKN